MQKFLKEAKRRNVFRVAFVYIIAAWLTMQVVDVMFPALNVPAWVTSAIAVVLLIGLPFALIFAWAFEMTPDGIKRERDVDRSQSITSQTGQKLNHLFIVILAVAVGFLLVDKFMLQKHGQNDSAETALAEIKPSIAVLPFVNMSGDKENEYFSDGLSEELLNVLARIPQLHVAGRTSSFQFKGTNEDLRLIGQKLNVANVLEGSVRRAGARLRITAQLIDTESGYHLWSNTYDRELTDIFAIQDEIAANVVEALRLTLLGEDTDTPSHGTDNIEAYNLYLQALYFQDHASEENYAKAEDSLRQAIALDPEYAQAYALRSLVHQQRISGFASDGTEDFIAEFDTVRRYAQQAMDLDPDLADAYAAMGIAASTANWDYETGVQNLTTALKLAPNHVRSLSWLGIIRLVQTRIDESIEYLQRSLQIDPLSIATHRDLGDALFVAGRHEEALDNFRNALRLQPDAVRIHGRMARVFLVANEWEKAAEHIRQEPVGWVRDMYAIMLNSRGQDSDALQAAAQSYADQYGESNSFQLAEIYAYVGDLDNTFKWLEKSHEVHDPGLIWVQVSVVLTSARNDPRWPEILELAGF